MEFLTPDLLGQLGIAGVLAVFLALSWRRNEKQHEQNREDMRSKDARIREMTDRLTEKYEENTRMTEGVKSSLDKNTEAINRNTATSAKVLDRFSEVMRGKNG
jgi:arginine deiminase